MKPISQREARQWRARCHKLEETERERRRSWNDDWPGGRYIARISLSPEGRACVLTARRLGHACVILDSGNIFALPLTSEPIK